MNKTKFVKTIEICNLSEKEKQNFVKMNGNILLWICEGRSMDYMSKNLNLPPWQIEHNINEMLYDLRKHVGIRRFIKTLFMK